MDILATFPTVHAPGAAVPRQGSVSCAKTGGKTGPRRSRSITLLAVVAACTWGTVWWLEQHKNATQPAATMAVADGGDGESVAR